MVAQANEPELLFAGVTSEVSRLLDLPVLSMVRFEPDATATVIAASAELPFPVGTNLRLDGPSVIASIFETGEPAEIHSYDGLPGEVADGLRRAGARMAFGAPIVTGNRVWGAMAAAVLASRPLSPDAAARLRDVTELVALAVVNTQTLDELQRLAREQASLRRVATLVASGGSQASLFDAVAEEVRTLFDVPFVAVERYEQRLLHVIGAAGGNPDIPVGGSWPLDGPSVSATILETGRPARRDEYRDVSGAVGEIARTAGFQSVAGAPIVVDAATWGAIIAVSTGDRLPDGCEHGIAAFTELVATAISNAASREELIASRARIVAAADEARRRIERDLHDGTQQRLIALGLDVQLLLEGMSIERPGERAALDRLTREIESILSDVQELSRGVHPPSLSRGGLRAALATLARRSPLPVELRFELLARPPEPLETCIYFFVSEALANAAKHSQADQLLVVVEEATGLLRARVTDDGNGGASIGAGSGLLGLRDRVEALGGRLRLESSPGEGTSVAIELPLPDGF